MTPVFATSSPTASLARLTPSPLQGFMGGEKAEKEEAPKNKDVVSLNKIW
jgi:hypothetical protein